MAALLIVEDEYTQVRIFDGQDIAAKHKKAARFYGLPFINMYFSSFSVPALQHPV